jgi:hypothetical protein
MCSLGFDVLQNTVFCNKIYLPDAPFCTFLRLELNCFSCNCYTSYRKCNSTNNYEALRFTRTVAL